MAFLCDLISMISPNHSRVMARLKRHERHVACLLVIHFVGSFALMVSFHVRISVLPVRVDDFHDSKVVLDPIYHPYFIQSSSESLKCMNEIVKQSRVMLEL
jgi:hypothetical protein